MFIQLSTGGHVVVCNDSFGTTQFAPGCGNHSSVLAGLSAADCYALARALIADGDRQRRMAKAPVPSSFYAAMLADEQTPA